MSVDEMDGLTTFDDFQPTRENEELVGRETDGSE